MQTSTSLRARKNPFAVPLRPTRTSDPRGDKPESDTSSSFSRNRPDPDKYEEREETISIRKKLADRREAEKEKENEADKKDDEEDNALLSAQRARRSRRPREKRKATGVAYMPGEVSQGTRNGRSYTFHSNHVTSHSCQTIQKNDTDFQAISTCSATIEMPPAF